MNFLIPLMSKVGLLFVLGMAKFEQALKTLRKLCSYFLSFKKILLSLQPIY